MPGSGTAGTGEPGWHLCPLEPPAQLLLLEHPQGVQGECSPHGEGQVGGAALAVLRPLADAEPGSTGQGAGSECKASTSSLAGLKKFIPKLTVGHGAAGSGAPRAGQELKARQLLSCTWMPAEKLWM